MSTRLPSSPAEKGESSDYSHPLAFLTTLRANLNLDVDSAPTSLTNTPDSLRPVNMASSTGSLPPPSPMPLAPQGADSDASVLRSADPLADVPSLTTALAVSEDDRVEGLRLVADSVAQQRQLASRAIIFHPITLAVLVLLLGLIYQHWYRGARSDWALIGTTFCGTLMAVLITIRWLSRGYIDEAEKIGTWKWLDQGREDDDVVGDVDEILITRFGDEAIGALVIRGVREGPGTNHGNSSPKKKRQSSWAKNAPVKGLIRGWTVKNRYRRKGIGTGLLEEAISLCQDNGWTGPEFADDHANSARMLPSQFNGGFDRRERQARQLLEKVKEESGLGPGSGSGKKGRR